SERGRLWSLEGRSYIADVECTSGGTGFAIIEMPDTVTATTKSGFDLAATVSQIADLEASVDLAAIHFAATLGRSSRFLAGVPVVGGGLETGVGQSSDDGIVPIRSIVRVPFQIDLPDFERRVARRKGVVPVGRSFVVTLEQATGGDARLVIARALVRAPGADGDGARNGVEEGGRP